MTESFAGGIDADFEGASDAGCKRPDNEDRFIIERVGDTDYVIAAVIDGLGGQPGGEFAAEIARRVILDNIYAALPGANPAEALHQAFINANNMIVDHREADARVAHMGCVAVAALFSASERKIYMVNCGDSRMYRFSGGMLTKLSHDQSPVGRLEDSGAISEEEAMSHSRRNIVDHCLGLGTVTTDSERFVETQTFDIAPGEASYLLCSDGLTDMLTSAEIATALAEVTSSEAAVASLIEKAKEAGGRDNVTAVVVNIHASDAPAVEAQKPDSENTRDEEAKQHRKIKLPHLSRKALHVVAWGVFLAALLTIVALGIKKYTHEVYPDKGEVIRKDSTTVFVMVDNELDSVKVDTISRVVLQARDSIRVDIPR